MLRFCFASTSQYYTKLGENLILMQNFFSFLLNRKAIVLFLMGTPKLSIFFRRRQQISIKIRHAKLLWGKPGISRQKVV